MKRMVDSDFRFRVLRALRLNSIGPAQGISLRGLKTVLCANAGLQSQRVEEALEELIELGAVEYDGEILQVAASDN